MVTIDHAISMQDSDSVCKPDRNKQNEWPVTNGSRELGGQVFISVATGYWLLVCIRFQSDLHKTHMTHIHFKIQNYDSDSMTDSA